MEAISTCGKLELVIIEKVRQQVRTSSSVRVDKVRGGMKAEDEEVDYEEYRC